MSTVLENNAQDGQLGIGHRNTVTGIQNSAADASVCKSCEHFRVGVESHSTLNMAAAVCSFKLADDRRMADWPPSSEFRYVKSHGGSVSPLQAEFRNNLIARKNFCDVSHCDMQGVVEGVGFFLAGVLAHGPVHSVGGDVPVGTVIHPNFGAAVVQSLGVKNHALSLSSSAQPLQLVVAEENPEGTAASTLGFVQGLLIRQHLGLSATLKHAPYGVEVRVGADGASGRLQVLCQKVDHPPIAQEELHEDTVTSWVTCLTCALSAGVGRVENSPTTPAHFSALTPSNAGCSRPAHKGSVGECKAKIQPQDVGVVDRLRRAA